MGDQFSTGIQCCMGWWSDEQDRDTRAVHFQNRTRADGRTDGCVCQPVKWVNLKHNPVITVR